MGIRAEYLGLGYRQLVSGRTSGRPSELRAYRAYFNRRSMGRAARRLGRDAAMLSRCRYQMATMDQRVLNVVALVFPRKRHLGSHTRGAGRVVIRNAGSREPAYGGAAYGQFRAVLAMPVEPNNLPEQVWGYVLAGASPAAIIVLWKNIVPFIKWVRGESLLQTSRDQTTAQKMQDDITAQRALLSREQNEFLDRVNAELTQSYARIAVVRSDLAKMERDRDRGWDLARWWYRRAQVMRDLAWDAQSKCDFHMAPGTTCPIWPTTDLPAFEDAIPVRPE